MEGLPRQGRHQGQDTAQDDDAGAGRVHASLLLHVLPGGFHRIRHYGLLANGNRKAGLALARELLHAPAAAVVPADGGDLAIEPPKFVCWHCGCAMVILQTLTRGSGPAIRGPPTEQVR
jgi:Putative transposase